MGEKPTDADEVGEADPTGVGPSAEAAPRADTGAREDAEDEVAGAGPETARATNLNTSRSNID